jgi:hypothetical protein
MLPSILLNLKWSLPLRLTDFSDMCVASVIKAISLILKAERTSETSVYFYETTRHHITEGCHYHTHRHENEIQIINTEI